MAIIELKCPSCGAPLKISPDADYSFCEYCGTQFKESKQHETQGYDSDYCEKQLNDKISEKEFLEQELTKLESDISSNKEYLKNYKSNYNNATAHRGLLIILYIFSIIVTAVMIAGVVMEHSLVMLAFGILFVILIIVSINGIQKKKNFIKEYTKAKHKFKTNDAKQRNMLDELKKLNTELTHKN